MSPREYNLPVMRRRPPHALSIAALALATLMGQLSLTAQSRSLAPYVPTPSDVVDRMLTLAKVGARDVVYDLGCGDGRIVITAAQKFGARGVGVDIDANLINQAEANAKAAGVDRRVKFLVQDAMTVDVSDATVVTLYLLSASNVKLRPILTRQLRRFGDLCRGHLQRDAISIADRILVTSRSRQTEPHVCVNIVLRHA